jgi:glucose 1-dehydrogenase
MTNNLDGQVAVVTGADSGIGRAVALELARAGADIAIVYHSDAKGAEASAQDVAAAGRRVLTLQADVRDQRAVADMFDTISGKLGVPRILVNSASIGAGGIPVAETTGDDWDQVIRTDLYGPFYCCRHFVQARKREGGGGKIVSITSVHERIPSPGNAAYGAAKGGLLTFTRSLALEVAPDRINVNAVAPGMIHTPMTAERAEDPEKRREAEKHIPWGRPGEPWEVARLVLYLAGPDSDYVTGQSFTIDGGLEMNWGQGA